MHLEVLATSDPGRTLPLLTDVHSTSRSAETQKLGKEGDDRFAPKEAQGSAGDSDSEKDPFVFPGTVGPEVKSSQDTEHSSEQGVNTGSACMRCKVIDVARGSVLARAHCSSPFLAESVNGAACSRLAEMPASCANNPHAHEAVTSAGGPTSVTDPLATSHQSHAKQSRTHGEYGAASTA
jgi:hypothetical protein